MERRKRRTFTEEFKAEAVRLAQESGKSLPQVAKDLDLTESALRQWVQHAERSEAPVGPEALSQAEREELHQLRRENRQLMMERDFLKKPQPSSRRRARSEVRVHPSAEGALPGGVPV
ncbi:Transposase orfA-like, IS3 family [Stigmatella aurantiaca DW4/3-1]|uniref:Transposase n=1 Tax=Stigmatella aurantiaca (strain DW4/3-1) TaxID=378806 RepID=Q08VS5_STIAD|nr:Transposase orfA-like, IS3 family [Stigmatella aurantiaca DW4/3-1]EAU64588.1 transposase [Stigmatella aurantiaca DW4/3-1]